MYKGNKQVHTVDFLFTMSLFCIFSLTAFFILFIGADIYQSTASNLGENTEAVTTMTYISEKVRQQDAAEALSLDTIDDIPVLVIKSQVNDTDYVTYIYEYEGQLKELYCRADMDISLSGGETISQITDFAAEQVSSHLYRITITDTTDRTHMLLLSTRSM